jgi:hypothetical protein
MSPEDIKNYAAALQSAIISIGILIGGGWAMFTFLKLKSIDKASAELEKVRRDLARRGMLEERMTAVFIRASDGTGSYIQVRIELKNVGTGVEVIRWRESGVQAARVLYGPLGAPVLEEASPGFHLRIDHEIIFQAIAPGATEGVSFLVPIGRNGTYLIDATILASPAEVEATAADAKRAGVVADLIALGSTTFLEVNEIN